MVYVLKPTKIKKTNKIILIAFIWELRTLGDAPKHVAVMCPCMYLFILFYVCVFVC